MYEPEYDRDLLFGALGIEPDKIDIAGLSDAKIVETYRVALYVGLDRRDGEGEVILDDDEAKICQLDVLYKCEVARLPDHPRSAPWVASLHAEMTRIQGAPHPVIRYPAQSRSPATARRQPSCRGPLQSASRRR